VPRSDPERYWPKRRQPGYVPAGRPGRPRETNLWLARTSVDCPDQSRQESGSGSPASTVPTAPRFDHRARPSHMDALRVLSAPAETTALLLDRNEADISFTARTTPPSDDRVRRARSGQPQAPAPPGEAAAPEAETALPLCIWAEPRHRRDRVRRHPSARLRRVAWGHSRECASRVCWLHTRRPMCQWLRRAGLRSN
jgi:hypothetical protein